MANELLEANWDEYLLLAALAYNNTRHRGTKQISMEVLFGFVTEIPMALKEEPSSAYNHEYYPNVYQKSSNAIERQEKSR